jgi:hypothetical protein
MRHHQTVLFAMFHGRCREQHTAQHRGPAPPLSAEQKDREAKARERASRPATRLRIWPYHAAEAAQRSNGALTVDWRPNPDWFKERDVRGLADRSALVIVGRPYAARVELTTDRRSIVTTYAVQVDETFKERQVPPFMQQATVRIPGGRLESATVSPLKCGPDGAEDGRALRVLPPA